jgi:putative ABC transport system permease protein
MDGNGDQTMQSQTGVVISRKMAQKYFGDENAINKVISIQLNDAFEEYTVGAVVEDMPTNSSIQFDLMISDLNFPKIGRAPT